MNIIDKIKSGFIYSLGLYQDEDMQQISDLLNRCDADAIETIRIVFTDQHGILRGKTITSAFLPSAFTSGIRVPSTLLLKDLSHKTVFPVWSDNADTPFRGASDILLIPVPDSFVILPYSKHSALMHCDVAETSGKAIAFSSRHVLSQAVKVLKDSGYEAVFGTEVEFQIFRLVDQKLNHCDTTMPGTPPATRAFNQGYQYLTETRYDAAEDLLDCLRRTAQSMNMPVQSVEIEMGPSQFEFTFAPSDPMTVAERHVNFRTMVKEVCARQGFVASFMAKPKLENAVANGWHIHQSIVDIKRGENAFITQDPAQPNKIASQWIAGLLQNARASCLFTTPTVNGYKRYAPYQLAPNKIGWGLDNRGAMVRALLSHDNSSRIENRVPDSTVNPYFALASQICSGQNGLQKALEAPIALADPYDAKAERLPTNLMNAIESFEASELYRHIFGSEFVQYMSILKKAEWERYLMTVSEWEQKEYFSAF